MKKVFIPLTALALLAMTACGSKGSSEKPTSEGGDETSTSASTSPSSEERVFNSLTITNAEELQATWYVGRGTREVSLSADPVINVGYEMNEGNLVITSSDPSVISVQGLVLNALKAGKATITARIANVEDSVEITVSEFVETADTRHEDYATLTAYDYAKDATEQVPLHVQGKIVQIQQYSDSSNINVAIQEGKYGYFVNNVPAEVGEGENKHKLVVGDSISLRGNTYVGTKAKLYGGLAFIANTLELIEEVEIEDPILLGDEEASFLDSRCAKMTLGENVGIVDDISKAAEGVIGFKVGEASYRFSYVPSGQVASEALAAKLAGVGIGTKITKLDGVWGGSVKETDCSDLIAVGDANDIEIAYADPTEVTISGPTEVQAGSSIVLSAEVAPSGAKQEVVWSVDDETKAHFDGNTLYADVEGTVVVSATAVDDDTVVGTYSITITEAPSVNVESITVSAPTDVTGAAIGETVQMSAEVLPSNALQGVNWISSNEDVATVDENGLVTFLADGSVEITASAKDESGVVSSAVTLTTVIDSLKTFDELCGLATKNASADKYSFRGKVLAMRAKNNLLVGDGNGAVNSYSSVTTYDDIAVGDVVLITGKIQKYSGALEFTSGTCVKSFREITGTATEPTVVDKTAYDEIATMGDYVSTGLYIKVENAELTADGQYVNLTKIGSESVVSTTYAGMGVTLPNAKVVGKHYGTLTAWVYSSYASKTSATIWVDSWTPNADSPATSVTVSAKADALEVGGELSFSAWVSAGEGKNASQEVTWSVDNTALAEIDNEGVLTAKAAGTVVVTATAVGTTVSGSKTITINSAVATVSHEYNMIPSSGDYIGTPSPTKTVETTLDGQPTLVSADVKTASSDTATKYYSYLMFAGGTSGAKPYCYNTTAYASSIVRVIVTLNKGNGASAYMKVDFGTSALSAYPEQAPTSSDQVAVGGTTENTDYTFTCGVEDATYFRFAVANKNAQVVKITVVCEAA